MQLCSDSSCEEIQRIEEHCAILREVADLGPEVAREYAGQLGHDHDIVLAIDAADRCDRMHRAATRGRSSRAQWNNDARGDVAEEIRLHVQQQREARPRGLVQVLVDAELRHRLPATQSVGKCAVLVDRAVVDGNCEHVVGVPPVATSLAELLGQGTLQGRRKVDATVPGFAQQ